MSRLEALADQGTDEDIAVASLERLAVLSYDAHELSRARHYIERALREHPEHEVTNRVRLLSAYVAHDEGDPETELASLVSILCPTSGADPLVPRVPGEPDLAVCTPRELAPPYLAHAWLELGEIYFDASSAGDLARAEVAFARAADAPDPGGEVAPVALYKRAWALFRESRFADALAGFTRVLDEPRLDLGGEALQYLALCIVEKDWDDDGHDDRRIGLRRPEVAAFMASSPHAADALAAAVRALLGEARCDEARAMARALAERDPAASGSLEPLLARCAP